ncbi:MAG: hypothetical protein HRT77_09275 [Halioglobus sp.]|nr:hypothetical protein [Halioglobus sp.]
MDVLLILLALTLPVLLGGFWLNLLIPATARGRSALVWGHGALMGWIVIAQIMWLLDALDLPLSFTLTGCIVALFILLAAAMTVSAHPRSDAPWQELRVISTMSVAQRALFIFLLCLIAIRVATLGLEVLWRPLFPWDATMHWATKARVWFEHQSLVPFVDKETWLDNPAAGMYTDRHPNYPTTVPLLQVWMNLSIGRWDESLMNLPWLMCLLAMGAAFYGQLRSAEVGPAIAMTFTYFLLSMPLINTHVALAGYADLFLGACYCAALMALHNWVLHRQTWQMVLLVLFAFACVRLKMEGFLWALMLLPGLIVALATRHALLKLVLLASLGLALLIVFRQFAPGSLHPFLQQFTPLSMKGLMGVIKSLFLHANWHLLPYLIAVCAGFALLLPWSVTRKYRGIGTALALSVAAFLFLFLFTVFWMGSANFTGVGRLSIQLMPSIVFLCALLCNETLTRGNVWPARQAASTAT